MKLKSLLPFSLFILLITFSAARNPAEKADIAFESPFGNKRWMIASTTISPALDVNMDGNPDTDLMILLEPCERDDADQYLPDGTILTHRGRLKCDEEEEPESEAGTWSYDAGSKTLVLDRYDSSRPVTGKVVSVSANEIVITASHQSATGMHTIRTVLKAKN